MGRLGLSLRVAHDVYYIKDVYTARRSSSLLVCIHLRVNFFFPFFLPVVDDNHHVIMSQSFFVGCSSTVRSTCNHPLNYAYTHGHIHTCTHSHMHTHYCTGTRYGTIPDLSSFLHRFCRFRC